MTQSPRLTTKHMDCLMLISRSIDPVTGWAPCSDNIWPHIQGLPDELVVYDDVAKRVCLTRSGIAVAKYAPGWANR